jgi:hypothetical protein
MSLEPSSDQSPPPLRRSPNATVPGKVTLDSGHAEGLDGGGAVEDIEDVLARSPR